MKIIISLIFLFISIGIISTGIVIGSEDDGSTEEKTIFEEESEIGHLVGGDLNKGDVVVQGVELYQKDGRSRFTFKEEGGKICIKGNCYENIQVLSSSGTPSLLTIEDGEVVSANFLTNEEGGIYNFGKGPFIAPANSRVIYSKEGGNPVLVKLEEGSEINFENLLPPKSGNKVYYEGSGFTVDGESIYGGKNLVGKIGYVDGKIVEIFQGTSASVKGISHVVLKGNLNLYYDNNFDSSKYLSENYFNYGKNKINLGGDGFRSIVNENNDIFPEYIGNKYLGSFTERQAKLEFLLEGGTLEVSKISPDESPLALDIKSTGKSTVNNGNWIIESDGENVYAKVEKISQFPLTSDIRYEYQPQNGNLQIFDLDIDSSYYGPLSENRITEVNAAINHFQSKINTLMSEKENLMKDPIILGLSLDLDNLHKQLNENSNLHDEFRGQLERAERAGTPTQVAQIHTQLNDNADKRYAIRLLEGNLLRKNPILTRIQDIGFELRNAETAIKDLEFQKNTGELKIGIWGQIITSDNGDAEVSYSEYIEGYPVIKNTDSKYYYGEEYRPDLGVTVSGGRLVEGEEHFFKKNIDILDLIVDSKLQTCADTQIELHSRWNLEQLVSGKKENINFKISNGRELQYRSDGTYTIWSESENKVVSRSYQGNIGEGFDNWISNVQAYTNTGSLRDYLIQTSDVDNLKPGDFLTLHADRRTGYGHTKAIKEIIRFPDGEIYYRMFAGYDPAIDATMSRKLITKNEMEKLIANPMNIALTWP